MAIKVSIGVDDRMFFLELIGTFPANSISLMGKSPNSDIGGARGSLIDKIEHA